MFLIDFVSWDWKVEKKNFFFEKRSFFFFETRNARWECLFEWDKMLEKKFWFLFTCDYFKSRMFFYQRDVFMYSRNVFMYSKKCLSILTFYLFKTICIVHFSLIYWFRIESFYDYSIEMLFFKFINFRNRWKINEFENKYAILMKSDRSDNEERR